MITVVFGSAGCGKTTFLAHKYAELLEKYSPKEIVFLSYTKFQTRHGARKIKSVTHLNLKQLECYTLHSYSKHAVRKDASVFHEGYVNKMSDYLGIDMKPVERGIAYMKNIMSRNDAVGANKAGMDVKSFQKKKLFYETVKAKMPGAKEFIDFSDMIAKAVTLNVRSNAKVLICDECFAPNTRVRMADMSVKEIKDVKIGDYVMGTHGPTKVIRCTVGRDRMFNVGTGLKNVLFTCNSRHLIQQYIGNKHEKWDWTPISQLTSQPKFVTFQCTNYKESDLAISPYFLGLWLGNGFSREAGVVCNNKDMQTINWLKEYGEKLGDNVLLRNRPGTVQVEYSSSKKHWHTSCKIRECLKKYGFLLSKSKLNKNRKYKEKCIPLKFMQSSRKQRLELLAGLIDSDGMYVKSGEHSKIYRIEMAREKLSRDIFNLVGSLGFNPTWRITNHITNGIKRTYYRIDFYGSEEIPCLLPRKQFVTGEEIRCRTIENKPKSVWVKKGEIGDYIGIEVDAEDNLFLLENGCVVHNCQDFTPLHWKALYTAFKDCDEWYIAGDPMQSLYRFHGAVPNYMFEMRADETIILDEGHRCGKEVMQMAQLITNQMDKSIPLPTPMNYLKDAFAVFYPDNNIFPLFQAINASRRSGLKVACLAMTFRQLVLLKHRLLGQYSSTYPSNFISGKLKEFYKGEEKNPLVFSTVHQAKGLEFDYVLINSSFGLTDFFTDYGSKEENEQDYWRLMFVAITRAKRGVIVCNLSTPKAGEPNSLNVLYYSKFNFEKFKEWMKKRGNTKHLIPNNEKENADWVSEITLSMLK